MLTFALNHITAPKLDWRALLKLSVATGCAGVEFRTDLGRPLFEGFTAELVCDEAAQAGQRILSLGPVLGFERWCDALEQEVASLITTAQDLEAEAILLAPDVDGWARGGNPDLRQSLRDILPMLQEAEISALIEPYGFETAAPRSKAETLKAIDAVGGGDHFRLVHDTFHHALSGEEEMFPERTGLVQISGVAAQNLPRAEMTDKARGLVTADDRLGTCAQLARLLDGGYTGVCALEAHSTEVQLMPDHRGAISKSLDLITASVTALRG